MFRTSRMPDMSEHFDMIRSVYTEQAQKKNASIFASRVPDMSEHVNMTC